MVRAQAEFDEAAAERAAVDAPARADEVAAAEGRVAAAEAKLRLDEADLAKTRLLAPFDGQILRIYAEPGELAGPATVQPVLLFADTSRRRVRAFVEELDSARVWAGQPAVVTADSFPGREFPGKVALIAPGWANVSSRVTNRVNTRTSISERWSLILTPGPNWQ